MSPHHETAAEVSRSAQGKKVAGGHMIKCPAAHHDDRTPSCKVWDGPDGSVMFHCFGGCDWRDVRAGAEALGLMPAWSPNKPAPISRDRRREIEHARREREQAEAHDRDRRRQWASRIWARSKPLEGTAAERYLASRGLQGPYPSALRFIPLFQHRIFGGGWPAMVAAVRKGNELVAIHITALSRERVAKAEISQSRIIIGPAAGGAIHLGEPQESLIVAEGIETALSAQQGIGKPAWAAISASMMKRVELPQLPLAQQLYIAADGDRAGIDAANALASSARRQGRVVRVVAAPSGKDWNDVLQEQMK